MYHVYSLPPELLDTLTPRSLVNQTIQQDPTPELITGTTTSGQRTCTICLGATFLDLEDQRRHFRSDWHRYNVKTRLNGGNSVSETIFAQLVDGLEDSISGSASSSDEDDSEDVDAVNALVIKTKSRERSPSPESGPRFAPQTALAWFHSPPSTQIGIYRAIFSHPKDGSSHLSNLKAMQGGGEDGRTWAMFMVAGGHFAGAVVRVSRPDQHDMDDAKTKKNLKRPISDTEVIRHKTFHRYTTRRKQGGSQSLNDNAKGNAKSAGAQLRRYGEQALRDDIRNLLLEWSEDIGDCERIWIRASSSNRKIFMNYEGAVILKSDERLRTFPFPTRRPTQSELSRCLLELTKVKVSHLTEDALRVQDEAYLASLPKPKAVPPVTSPEPEKPKLPKLSKEEEALREKWFRLLGMVSKGRLEPLKTFWNREAANIGSIDVQIPEWTGERRATLLQVSTQAGHEDVTHWLLEEVHADPTISVPLTKIRELEEEEYEHQSDVSDGPIKLPTGSRRTAYDLARTKGVRDVFRRCAAAHPDWWDWFSAGHVPSGLSKQMEDDREEKKKVRRKGLRDRVREREAKEREKEKERPPPVPLADVVQHKQQPLSSSNRLGGGAGAGEGLAGLTPELRAKVERERRARAAEARLKALGTK